MEENNEQFLTGWSTSRFHTWSFIVFRYCFHLSSNTKLFTDATSLFSVIHEIQTSANNLNKDLERISKWVTQWKMNFNPDTTKQTQKVIFSRKLIKQVQPPPLFNNSNDTWISFQKQLGIILDTQSKIDDHLKMVSGKTSKEMQYKYKYITITKSNYRTSL